MPLERSEMKLAIDPGSQHVGVSLWLEGKPLPLKTIHAKGETYEARCQNIRTQLIAYLCEQETAQNSRITDLAIEAFQQKYTRIRRKRGGFVDTTIAIRKLERATGFIEGVVQQQFFLSEHNVHRINKGSVPKTQAQLMAHLYKLTGTADAMDALHIGVLAGFAA